MLTNKEKALARKATSFLEDHYGHIDEKGERHLTPEGMVAQSRGAKFVQKIKGSLYLDPSNASSRLMATKALEDVSSWCGYYDSRNYSADLPYFGVKILNRIRGIVQQ